MKWRRLVPALALAVAVTGGCGDGRMTVRGIVIEVEGSITDVDGFLLRLDDGTRLRLRPAEGLLFHDNAPIGHIRDHLRSGESIEVEYELLDDGTAVAHAIDD